MGAYCFGLGRGHLPVRVARAAARAGGTLVNHTDPGCSCGHGCTENCPAQRRHWFEVENLGSPHNEGAAARVLEAVRQKE